MSVAIVCGQIGGRLSFHGTGCSVADVRPQHGKMVTNLFYSSKDMPSIGLHNCFTNNLKEKQTEIFTAPSRHFSLFSLNRTH